MQMRGYMGEADHDSLLETLDDKRIVAARIAELLRSNGYNVSNDTVARCRNRRSDGLCRCQ